MIRSENLYNVDNKLVHTTRIWRKKYKKVTKYMIKMVTQYFLTIQQKTQLFQSQYIEGIFIVKISWCSLGIITAICPSVRGILKYEYKKSYLQNFYTKFLVWVTFVTAFVLVASLCISDCIYVVLI